MANSSQLIFLEGKEIALKSLFQANNSEEVENFGYLAIGYDPEATGFVDEEGSTISDKGFQEISEDSNYTQRLELEYLDTTPDYDTSTVLVRFKAVLPSDVIIGQNINQFAVVNNSTPNSADTKIYSASTFPVFNKTNTSSITFIVSFRM